MTMLDRMRQHKNWLKWSLAVVCLAFVLFYIPAFLEDPNAGAAPGEVLAQVEGVRITAGQFRRVYAQQLQAYQAAYGGNMNQQLLRQLGLDRQILQQLIDEEAAVAEARRLGLRVTDVEVRERILALPAFQDGGRFIGEARYRQLLRLQRPPLTPAEFEENLRRGLLLDKMRSALTDWMTIADGELDQEFRRRNEKVKLEIVTVPSDRYLDKVTVSDAEIQAHFDGHASNYRVPEKRKVRFVALDLQALREKVVVTPADVQRAYDDAIEQYSTPEQVRASHILLKTEGPDEAAVRKRAEDLLAKVRGGADFAELARNFSEDEGSKVLGGDLDYFGRGRMVPEFEQVAFSLDPGQVSDIVQTQFGLHIIKVVDRRPAATRPLDEVREQITDQLRWERAQAQAEGMTAAMRSAIREPADLDRVATLRGLTVQESGFFAPNEPIAGIGPAPQVTQEAFQLDDNQVAGPVQTPQGFVFFTVAGRQDAYIPKLDEVRDRVRADVAQQKAVEMARKEAAAVAAKLQAASNFAAAAKAAGLEAQTSDLLARDAPVPGVGVSQEVEAVAFALPAGGTSDPIVTPSATAIIRVTERQEVTAEQIAAGRDGLREELLAERRGQFFNAYMSKAKQRMRIEINRATLERVIA